jgi:ABC-2 type transport system permease protein
VANELIPTTLNWYLFGIFTVCLTVFFSVISKSTSGVLLGTGGTVLISYLLEMIPKVKEYCPTRLMNTAHVAGGEMPSLEGALAITAAISIICIAASIPIFNKKQL